MDEEKEEVVNSEENVQENNNDKKTTYTLEEVEEMKAQIKAENEAKFDEKFNKRWGKEQHKLARENAEKDELIELLKNQTGKDNVKDLLDLSYEQYGVERPNISNSKDEEILGKYDAKEILELDDESIEEEAQRLADNKKRTAREEATFMELGKYLTSKKTEAKRKQEIKEAGIDEEVLNNKDFTNFINKFNENVSLKDIYDIYTSMHENKKQKPFSAGSLKGTNTENKNEIKDYYTYEESLNFTRKDFDKNPKLFEAIERSMPLWGKK